MKGVDTNVLVRFLARDDRAQYRAAVEFFETMRAAGQPVRVDAIVLCELVWVLRSSYGYAKPDLVAVLERMLSAEQLDVEDVDTAWLALADFKASRADFADCLIGRRNEQAGCATTVTLDGRLRGLSVFEPLPQASHPS